MDSRGCLDEDYGLELLPTDSRGSLFPSSGKRWRNALISVWMHTQRNKKFCGSRHSCCRVSLRPSLCSVPIQSMRFLYRTSVVLHLFVNSSLLSCRASLANVRAKVNIGGAEYYIASGFKINYFRNQRMGSGFHGQFASPLRCSPHCYALSLRITDLPRETLLCRSDVRVVRNTDCSLFNVEISAWPHQVTQTCT